TTARCAVHVGSGRRVIRRRRPGTAFSRPARRLSVLAWPGGHRARRRQARRRRWCLARLADDPDRHRDRGAVGARGLWGATILAWRAAASGHAPFLSPVFFTRGLAPLAHSQPP